MAIPNNQHHDATADFAAALSDPTRWAIKRGVPIFKPHQRTDPATGNLIKVDIPKLYRIAANMQRLERMAGVPIRLTLGHTEPGKPETHQPPVGGYYRNARVQPFGPSGEPAVVVDEWLDPQYLPERKNYPYRSAEYYDDAEQITGVALLTRDPYLDLGVVAYSRTMDGGATHYARTATGVSPVAYQFLTAGDSDMFPPVVPAPVVPATPPVHTPYSAPWGAGDSYNPTQTIPHKHTSTGAIYASVPGGMPPGMPGGMPPGQPQPGFPPTMNADMPGEEPDGDEAGLYALHHHLGQAVEHLSRYLSGRRSARYGAPGAAPTAPQSPFPPSGPVPNSRYGKNDPDPGAVAHAEEERRRRDEARGMDGPSSASPPSATPNSRYGNGYYARGTQPAATTISGLPVGYQLAVDKLQYELNEQKRATQVLLYERDQADTEWCVSEIRRLATGGYPVGEFELNELKRRPREHREAYLQHIATKYARVPVGEMPPPVLGDPTPGVNPNANRPATREEMDAALKMASNSNDPNAYQAALHYIRNGGAPANGVTNRLAGPAAPAAGGFPEPMPGEWGPGEPMPGMPPTFTDPYAQRNGY